MRSTFPRVPLLTGVALLLVLFAGLGPLMAGCGDGGSTTTPAPVPPPPAPTPPPPAPALALKVHDVPAEESSSSDLFDPEELTLWPRDWLRATTRSPAGNRVVADWEVSNPEVAKVRIGFTPDELPLRYPDDVSIEALAPGEAMLTASHEGAVFSVNLTVVKPPIVVERSLTDRPDDVAGPQIHAVYAVASDGEDVNLDRLGRIGWSLRATVDWLTEKLGRRLRVDTYGGGSGRDVPSAREDGNGNGWPQFACAERCNSQAAVVLPKEDIRCLLPWTHGQCGRR